MFKKIPNKFLSIKLLANFYSRRLYLKKNWLVVTHFFDQQDVDYRENNKPGDIHLETYIGGLVFGKKNTLRWRGYRKSHEIFSHANKKCATVYIHDKGRTKYNMIRCTIWICCLYDFLVSLKSFRSDLTYEDLVTKYWSSFKYKTLRTRKMIHAHKV